MMTCSLSSQTSFSTNNQRSITLKFGCAIEDHDDHLGHLVKNLAEPVLSDDALGSSRLTLLASIEGVWGKLVETFVEDIFTRFR
jgi:hypothetical protein